MPQPMAEPPPAAQAEAGEDAMLDPAKLISNKNTVEVTFFIISPEYINFYLGKENRYKN